MPTIIYEVKTGKAKSVEHMVDAKEAVANGSYTFIAPVKVKKAEVKKAEVKPEIKTSPKKPKFTKEVRTLKKPIRK
jgi:hypothetical protein